MVAVLDRIEDARIQLTRAKVLTVIAILALVLFAGLVVAGFILEATAEWGKEDTWVTLQLTSFTLAMGATGGTYMSVTWLFTSRDKLRAAERAYRDALDEAADDGKH